MPDEVSISIPQETAKSINEAFRRGSEGAEPDLDLAMSLAKGLAEAAFREYLMFITGDRVPAGIRDLRELRLRLLAERLPDGLPSDPEVAALFHLTSTQARTLVAGTRARYPEEFAVLFEKAAREAIRQGKPFDDGTVRITANGSLAAFLLDLLAESTVPAPFKRLEVSRRYDLKAETVEELRKRLKMKKSEIPSTK